MSSPLTPASERRSRWRQLLLLTAIALVVVLFFGLGLHRQLTLEALQQAHGALVERRRQSPLLVGGAYMGIYVLVAALSLPGAAVLTLAGGALFGLGLGTLLVSTRGRRVCMTCHWFRHHAGGGGGGASRCSPVSCTGARSPMASISPAAVWAGSTTGSANGPPASLE